MNKIVLGLICIVIILNCSIVFATENTTILTNENINEDNISEISDKSVLTDTENVNATKSGIRNITFSDGYNGYCINLSKDHAENGSVFTPKDTSHAMNNKYNTPIGNYLKILFVDFYDFAITDADATSEVIWDFSDRYYLTSTNEITQAILKTADTGRIIPDHGETKKINEHTEAIFDFQVFDPLNDDMQNYFGYKITLKEITNNASDNNTNNTNKSIVNQDLLKNTTNSTVKQNQSNKTTDSSSKQYLINDSKEELNQIEDTNLNKSTIISGKSTGNPILLLILICGVFCCIYRKI